MGSAKDEVIAHKAKDEKLAILSGRCRFRQYSRTYPPGEYFGIVVFRPGRGANTATVLSMIESLL